MAPCSQRSRTGAWQDFKFFCVQTSREKPQDRAQRLAEALGTLKALLSTTFDELLACLEVRLCRLQHFFVTRSMPWTACQSFHDPYTALHPPKSAGNRSILSTGRISPRAAVVGISSSAGAADGNGGRGERAEYNEGWRAGALVPWSLGVLQGPANARRCGLTGVLLCSPAGA